MEKRAVVLLSGGLDSSVTAAYAKSIGYKIYALTLVYGQKHKKEIESAKAVSKFLNVEDHRILELPDFLFNSSSLVGDRQVPVMRDINYISDLGIPTTYVPARNIVLLSIASAWAENLGAEAVFIGVNSLDYSGYPDCRSEFIKAFQDVLRKGTKLGVEGREIKIKTPLLKMTKGQIVSLGNKLGLDFSLTWSCYKGSIKACGVCDSCQLRIKGFKEAHLKDPIEYEIEINWED